MPLVCDIAMIFIHFHTLFDHIWTNLLTQCTPVPVSVFCCFCILGFSITKTVRKITEKYIKNQGLGPFRNPEAQPEGGHQGPRRPGGAPPRPRRGAAWAPLVPSD